MPAFEVIDGRPRVAILKRDILQKSETFISEQIRSYGIFKPVLLGHRIVDDSNLRGVEYYTPKLVFNSQKFSLLNENIRSLLRVPSNSMSELIRRFRPDILHAHFGDTGVYYYPTFSSMNIPFFVTLHGADITVSEEWLAQNGGMISRRYYYNIRRMALDPRVHFIAVSDYIKQIAVGKGIPEDRIDTCYIGVDTASFDFCPMPDRAFTILFVGRFVEKKGPAVLIDAFRQLQSVMPSAKLIMVGDGPLLTSMKQRAASLNVDFLGAVSHSRVKQCMTECHVLCLPSVSAKNGDTEGLGMVLLEAQAVGRTVVTSARGGATEAILDGETGFSFPEGDVNRLYQILLSLVQDRDQLSALGGRARAHVERIFDVRKCTERLESLYFKYKI